MKIEVTRVEKLKVRLEDIPLSMVFCWTSPGVKPESRHCESPWMRTPEGAVNLMTGYTAHADGFENKDLYFLSAELRVSL